MSPVKRSFQKTLTRKRLVDSTSKFLIITESFFGLNRLCLLNKHSKKQNLASAICSTVWVLLTIALGFFFVYSKTILNRFISTIEYILLCIVSFLLRNRLKLFYLQLDKFDVTFVRRFRTDDSGSGIKIAIFLCFFYPAVIFLYYVIFKEGQLVQKFEILFSIIIWSIHNCEYLYFSHLQSMITSRVTLIIEEVEKKLKAPGVHNTAPFSVMEIRKFIKLYDTLITAFDKLLEAFKWQLIILLLVPLISLLYFLLKRVDDYLLHKEIFYIICVVRITMFIIPLIWSSLVSERLSKRVLELRTKTSDYMYQYDKAIDPKGREFLSILITLTKLRNLSCVLFGIVKVNSVLPFKVISLLVTYLAVMLQFRKVVTIV